MKDWNVICDRCGFQYKSYELFREWTGHMVCRKCLDPREFEPRIKEERAITPIKEPDNPLPYTLFSPTLSVGSIVISGNALPLNIPLGAGTVNITGTDALLYVVGTVLIFGGATNAGGGFTDRTEKYNLFDDTIESGTDLSHNVSATSGICNTTLSVVLGYYNDGILPAYNEKERYFHADDTVDTTTELSTPTYYAGAGCISTMGVYMGGFNSSNVEQSRTETYTFSDETVTTENSLGVTRHNNAQCGNSSLTKAYMVCGQSGGGRTSRVDTFTFSNGTTGTTTALGGIEGNASIGGTPEFGFTAGGHTGGFFGEETEIYKLNYAAETWTNMGQLFGEVGELGTFVAGGSSDAKTALYVGGQQRNDVSDQIYLYDMFSDAASGTVVASLAPVDMISGTQQHSATCTAPGWQ